MLMSCIGIGLASRRTVKFANARAGLDSYLVCSGDRHVVFVRYLPSHRNDEEWVYNKADIDNAPVIWARDLGPAQNERVIAYYGKSRRYWLLEADSQPVQLKPYAAAGQSVVGYHQLNPR